MSSLIVAVLVVFQAIDEARALAARGDFASAQTVLEREIERSPTAPALAFLSQLQVMTDAIPQGTRSLARALELAPEQYRWRTTLGALYYRLAMLDAAEQELERVLRQVPSAPIARYYLAAVLKARGDLAEAEENARLAVKEMPDEPLAESLPRLDYSLPANATYLLAEIRSERGQDVEELLRRTLELEPTHPPAQYLLARSLLKRGRKEEGRNILARFEQTKRAQEHLHQGADYIQAGDAKRGVAEYRLALEACPDHPRVLYFLARELVRRGDRDEAQSLLSRLVELEPGAAPLVTALRQSR